MKKEISITGNVESVCSVGNIIQEILLLAKDNTFESLFMQWYHNQTDIEFKEFKKYTKNHFSPSQLQLKVTLADLAGIQVPCIKIITGQYKITIRIWFSINISVKEIK